MRIYRAALALVLGLLLAVAGCSKQVSGSAQPDPEQPPLAMSEDGYGVVAGFDDAPAQIEIYTEPQCSHCADLQTDFGDELAYNIRTGALQVTYRPLTFLDDEPNGYSARVSNALFLAADGGDANGYQFQRFVQELYGHQQRTKGGAGPTDAEMADLAKAAGMSDEVAERIEAAGSAVDTAAMQDMNFGYLYAIDMITTGTPTVYDPKADEKIDIYDNNWLNKLLQSA